MDRPVEATTEDPWIGGADQPVPAATRAVALPVVEGLGLELVGVELAQEGHRQILWVYIDGPDGVSIDDCARVSPELSAALDVVDPLPAAYELRVSSPGLDRPLMRGRDFERFAGKECKLQLSAPLAGRRRFTGVIVGIREGAVVLTCSDGEHAVPLPAIHRARLRFELTIGKKKTHR